MSSLRSVALKETEEHDDHIEALSISGVRSSTTRSILDYLLL